MDHKVTNIRVEIAFEGDEYNVIPYAEGCCQYRGDEYIFQVVEQNCQSPSCLRNPANAVFFVWLDESFGMYYIKPPSWADEDDDNNPFNGDPYWHEIEYKLHQTEEIHNIIERLYEILFENISKKENERSENDEDED